MSGGVPAATLADSFWNVSSVALLGMGSSSSVTLARFCLNGAALPVAHELIIVGVVSVICATIVTGTVLAFGGASAAPGDPAWPQATPAAARAGAPVAKTHRRVCRVCF